MHYLLLRNSGYFLFLSIILVLFNVDLNAQSGKSKDFSVSYSDKGDKDVKGYDPLGYPIGKHLRLMIILIRQLNQR